MKNQKVTNVFYRLLHIMLFYAYLFYIIAMSVCFSTVTLFAVLFIPILYYCSVCVCFSIVILVCYFIHNYFILLQCIKYLICIVMLPPLTPTNFWLS